MFGRKVRDAPLAQTGQGLRMTHRLLLLLAAAPMIMADGPPQSFRTWLLEQPIAAHQSVEVDLARAKVRKVMREGPLRVEITARGLQGLDSVQIAVQRTDGTISISDVYPIAPAVFAPSECEPPAGARGAFWRSDVVFDVLIAAPPGVQLRIRVMDARK